MARIKRRKNRVSVTGALLAAFFCAAAGAQEPPRQLSDLYLPIGEIASSGFSPDGATLVFDVNHQFRDFLDLYSVPTAGGPGDVTWLARRNSGSTLLNFNVSGSQVLFSAPDHSLQAVPVAGGEVTTLFTPGPGGRVFTFVATVDDFLVFRARSQEGAQTNVFTVPLSGGAASQLSQLPGSGWSAGSVAVTADGARVAYTGVISLPVEIFTVPTTGGTPVSVSHPLQAGQTIAGMEFSPDGSHLIYRVGNPATPNLYFSDLYSVPAAGGTPVLVHDGYNGSPNSQYQGSSLGADTFFITDDSSQILFADSNETVSDLYLADIDGSNKTLLDTQPLISRYWWRPAESRLFFQWENPNYSVGTLQLGGGGGVVLSVHPQGNLIPGEATVTPDSSRMVYPAFVQTGQRQDLYSVTATGDPPILLNDPLASPESVVSVAASETTAVFLRDRRLVSVPIAGGPETWLTDPLLSLGPFRQGALFPDGSAVRLEANPDSLDVEELFKVPVGGGPLERLSPSPPEVQGEVVDHVQSAGGSFVAYRSDRDDRDVFQVYETSTDALEGGVRVISPPLGPNESVMTGPVLAAAADTVLFDVNRSGSPNEVWATPFGGQPRLLFDLDAVSKYAVVEPGHVVHYLEVGELRELTVATGASRSLEDLVPVISDFQLSPNGSTLVLESQGDLYTLPVGGGTPMRIAFDAGLVAISPDGAWILADDSPSDFLLLSSDGVTTRNLGPLGASVGFSADAQFLIYEIAGIELWSYDIAGETSQRIDGGVGDPSAPFVEDWRALDGDQILFGYTEDSRWARRLYRVAAGGGAVTPWLPAELEGRQVDEAYFSADGRRVILSVGDTALGPRTLYSLSSAGGAATALDDGEGARFLAFSPDGQLVLYQRIGTDFTAPLQVAPSWGGGAAALTPEFFGDAQDGFVFGPGGLVTLRIARHDERTELYALNLGDTVLFLDGFESGDLTAWSAAVP